MTTIYRMTMEESRCEAVSPGAGISLLTLRGKSLLSWAKAAHSSGHLLLRQQIDNLLAILTGETTLFMTDSSGTLSDETPGHPPLQLDILYAQLGSLQAQETSHWEEM